MSDSKLIVRSAMPEDGPAIAAIYAPYVAHTAISFELEPPSRSEMVARIQDVTRTHPSVVAGLDVTRTHPSVVAELDGPVVGYTYASKHRERDAYRWSADVAVLTVGQYLRPSAWHLPIVRCYAPNEFVALREQALALGFRQVGSGPLVRSSYHAHESTENLRRLRTESV